MSSEDVKPAAQPISLRLKEQDGTETVFKVKPATKFEKVFTVFYSKKGTAPGTFKFAFEGADVTADQTPGELGMEDNSTIDVLIGQTGGAAAGRRD